MMIIFNKAEGNKVWG